MNLTLITVLSISILFAAGCGDTPPSKYPSQKVHVEDRTLGPGDIFQVRVFRQDDMTGQFSISSEGTISFPLIGVLKVEGKTPAQIERLIRYRLADGFLKNPEVSVFVKEYKSKTVSVFGRAGKPGTLGFAQGMSVVEAISQAGGFNNMARKNAVTVTRSRDGKKTKYTVPVESIGRGNANNFYMRPGDVVFVPRRVW